MSDAVCEDTENTGETIAAGTSSTGGKDSPEANPIAAMLLKVWNAVMIVCTLVLSFYVFVLKDDSAVPFVILGFIGLCMPPIVGLFRSMARNKQLAIEYEEKIRKAELDRIMQARENERKRLEREKMMAANEILEQNAIKNTDVSAINKSK